MDSFNEAKVFRKRAVTVEAFCLGTDIMPHKCCGGIVAFQTKGTNIFGLAFHTEVN